MIPEQIDTCAPYDVGYRASALVELSHTNTQRGSRQG